MTLQEIQEKIENDPKLQPFRSSRNTAARVKSVCGSSRKKSAGTCAVGERADLTGCTPASGEPTPKKPSAKKPFELRPAADKARREGYHPIQRNEDGSYSGKGVATEVLERAKAMKLPPAWSEVEISSDSKSSLQATGYDQKGREQRVYSAEHSQKAAAEKFLRVKAFVDELPKIEAKVKKVAMDNDDAAVLLLMRKTGFRIGGSAGHKLTSHKALGASSLTDKNVKIDGDKIKFSFTGKKGVRINQTLVDAELAEVLKPRLGKGRLFNTNEGNVRKYLHSIDGPFKPKDFRTVVAAESALVAMSKMPKPKDEAKFKKQAKEVLKRVSNKLGNTPSIALKSYVPPEVWQSEWGFPYELLLPKKREPKPKKVNGDD